MDCCNAYGFWYSDPDLVNLPKSAILAACSATTDSSYGVDLNAAHFYAWGFLGRCLRDALNSLSNTRDISFPQLAEATKAQWPLNSFIYDGYRQDLSTNYAIPATNVWAPVWTNTSDFVLDLILVTNAPPVISLQPTNIAAIVGTNVQFLVVAGGTEPLRYQWYFNGGTISKATNTTLVLSNVQLTNAGTYFVRVTNTFGRVTSSNAVLTVIVPDTTKPTNTITAPISGQRWSNSVFTVTGTARDNVQVSSIWYQLNGLGWNPATTTNHWTNWTASVTLLPGTNTVRAYALDTSGNSSLTNSVSFTCVVSDRLRVVVSGQGTLSPNYSNAVLEIGKSYTMTATAASGYAFTNWVISTNWWGGRTTNTLAVQFQMQSNLTLQVNFADVTKPTITITSPTASQKMTNALANVKGTARDNWGVGSVQYQLNGGAWGLATSTNRWTNWTAVLPLKAGTNVIKAYAVDLGGNASTTNTLSVMSSNTFNLRLGFSSAQPMTSNGLQLSLGVSPGISGRVEVSTNLEDWTTLTSFISTNATMQFRDSAATNYNRRFYRAVVP
ncbi:MAG: Ig-like domain-containing protein [Verrucomicrobiota bacterium]